MTIYILEFSLDLTHFYRKMSTYLDISVNQQVSILAVLNCIIILNCGYMHFIICETFFMCFIAKGIQWEFGWKRFSTAEILVTFFQSKKKKCSLIFFLKDRFWPTKIELEAYGSTFLHHGLGYLNSMRGEAMQVILPASRQHLALGLDWFGLWISLTLSTHCFEKDFRK